MEHTSGWLSLGPNPEVNTLPYPQTNWNSPMDTMENAKQLKALLCIHDETISKIQHLGRKSLIRVFFKRIQNLIWLKSQGILIRSL